MAPADDLEGVRRAALELMQEAMDLPQFERTLRLLEHAANRDEALAGMERKRTLAHGYYLWVGYLAWLEDLREGGAQLELNAAEATGLAELKRAREEFAREHPGCPQCGAPNEKFAMRCRSCSAEIKQSIGTRNSALATGGY